MAPVIHTPVEGFTGIVVGVDFRDGVGETDDTAALEYFERAGYAISDVVAAEGAPLTEEEAASTAASDSEGSPTPPQDAPAAPAVPAPPERPHPVKDNLATWFEYLTKIKPDHGLQLEDAKRKDVIDAVEAIESAQPE